MNISVERSKNISDLPAHNISVLQAGKHIDISFTRDKQHCYIRKVNKHHYVVIPKYFNVLSDEEKQKYLSDYSHWVEFSEQSSGGRDNNLATVAKAMKNLRNIINANVTNPANCLFLTLTYAENMTDPQRLYKDMKNFVARLRYYLIEHKKPTFEYINTIEPQGRGAFHAHCILIFSEKAPYIRAKMLEKLWGNGFIKIQKISGDVDNIGAYLTAYLSDLDLSEHNGNITDISLSDIKTVEKGGKTKAIIKGERLKLYPKGIHIYRCSNGIIIPKAQKCTRDEVKEIIKGYRLTFKRAYNLIIGNNYIFNIVSKMHYSAISEEKDIIDAKHPEYSLNLSNIDPTFFMKIYDSYTYIKRQLFLKKKIKNPENAQKFVLDFELKYPDLALTDYNILCIIQSEENEKLIMNYAPKPEIDNKIPYCTDEEFNRLLHK